MKPSPPALAGLLLMLVGVASAQVRVVAHLDVDETSVRRAVELLRETTDALRRGVRPLETGAAY